MPPIAVHVDPAVQRRHSLARESRALLAICARSRRKRDATSGADDAVPGHRRTGGQPGQHAADQAGPPRQAGAFRDQAIGADAPAWNAFHDAQDRATRIVGCGFVDGAATHAIGC
jgi:hypothetical protein